MEEKNVLKYFKDGRRFKLFLNMRKMGDFFLKFDL